MSARRRWLPALTVAAVVAAMLVWWRRVPGPRGEMAPVDRTPRLFPELDGVTLPPNLAPPGLRIEEPAEIYRVTVLGARGGKVVAASRRPVIMFSLRRWRALAAANAGADLSLTVEVRQAGRWRAYRPLRMTVAAEPIDQFLVFRWLTPLYSYWRDVGVYQRDLTAYRTVPLLHGRQFNDGCVNCHTFAQGSGRSFTLGYRSKIWGAGTLLVVDGRPQRVAQATGYDCWHPGGRLVTMSVNQVRQFFHSGGEETRDVLDLDSGIVCYRVAEGRFETAPDIAAPDYLETYPSWSPDGKWLYFARAPLLWRGSDAVPPPGYDRLRYSLVRLPYDEATNTWGRLEVIRSGEEVGRSLVFPRVSPDGRWLLYTSCDYGCFPLHRPSADLGLIDLATGRDVPLAINSDRADTWHSWSRNGRWIAFGSKRADGLFGRIYLSYFDRDGRAHAPVLLPERDPRIYDTLWYSYNVPELVAEPVAVSPGRLGRTLRSRDAVVAPLPPALAAPAPGPKDSPWREEVVR